MYHLGTEKFLLNLSTCMQKWGHKVKVVSYSFYRDSQYENKKNEFLWKEYLYKSIPITAYKQRHEPPGFHWDIENPPLLEFAEKILKQEQPDLLHIAHGMRVSGFALAAQRLGIPYVITLTDFFFLCPNCKLITGNRTLCAGPKNGEQCNTDCPEFNNDMVRKRLTLSEKILRSASRVAAPSKFLESLFKQEFPWLAPKIIPYGIDFSRIRTNKRTYNGSGKLVVLFAGQIDVHKGVHILIDAVKKMQSDKITVKIYGTGPMMVEQKLRTMADGDPRIQFCGVYSEEQLGDVFSSVDCVVVPSVWHENNTIVVREALASHVPCIVSNAGGMTEIIQEGKNGLVFRMGDSNHLKEILERLVNTPELLAQMKNELTAYSVTTVEQEAFAYEEEYSKALNKF